MSAAQLNRSALESGQFPNISARRLKNVVTEAFAPRYLVPGGPPALHLKWLENSLSTAELNQLFFLFTCRANLVLADFVREVYWERYAAGSVELSVADVKAFIQRGIDDGKTIKRWAPSTIKRMSSYLSSSCADFGLLGKRSLQGRRIIPYRIESKVAAYLAHDLHFSGLGDNAVNAHSDWMLFGLSEDDVRDELKRLALKGFLIHQSAGDIVHIGWKYKTMEAFIDVLAQG